MREETTMADEIANVRRLARAILEGHVALGEALDRLDASSEAVDCEPWGGVRAGARRTLRRQALVATKILERVESEGDTYD